MTKRTCPVCSKDVPKTGRCSNTTCNAYSHKVINEIIEDGEKECLCCGKHSASKVYRHTAYIEEELNWLDLCEECDEMNQTEMQEMWREYWGGRF